MNRKDARVTPLRHAAKPAIPLHAALNLSGAQIGRLVSVEDEVLHVLSPASTQPVAAKLAVAAGRERLQEALRTRQPVVLVFENGMADKPIIVGFVAPIPAIVEEQANNAGDARVVEADIDGRRVKLTGKDEIVLECGQASITLRRNGRVVIRGTHVESHSDGTNRIKGGQVRIN